MTRINVPDVPRVVCVVGQGYVGLPVAKAAVDAGCYVIGLEINQLKVDGLNSGRSPIEDVTDDDLKAMIELGRYKAVTGAHQVTDVHNAYPDAWVVTVPTPLRDGKPDLSMVINAAVTIGTVIKPGALVVLESTVAPGTTEGEFLKGLLYSHGTGTRDFHVAFSPERIDPGNQHFSFTNTNKLVAGIDQASLNVACDFYRSLLSEENVIPVATIVAAETAKLLENTFRHVNIALVNELAQHCDRLNIDVWEVINAAATKPYGFMKFTPGPGVGGHCLPVDPAYLGDRVQALTGQPFHFVDLAMRINAGQPEYIVQRAMRILNDYRCSVNGSRILLLGYAYKPNTGDARETPASVIRQKLIDLGARVDVLDPHVTDVPDVPITSVLPGMIKLVEYDLIILVTDHDVFKPFYGNIVDSGVAILDTRNVFPANDDIQKL